MVNDDDDGGEMKIEFKRSTVEESTRKEKD